MNNVSRAARLMALLYRLCTAASLILAFVLFICSQGSSLPRTIVFLIWIALMAYSFIRILTDLFSGQHRKEQNFQHTLEMLEKQTGSTETAEGTFFLVSLASMAVKLAVPVVLWLIFR